MNLSVPEAVATFSNYIDEYDADLHGFSREDIRAPRYCTQQQLLSLQPSYLQADKGPSNGWKGIGHTGDSSHGQV